MELGSGAFCIAVSQNPIERRAEKGFLPLRNVSCKAGEGSVMDGMASPRATRKQSLMQSWQKASYASLGAVAPPRKLFLFLMRVRESLLIPAFITVA